MSDLEIPIGKRTLKYRFFEMLPAILSYGALFLMVILSIFSPILASIYLLFIIMVNLVKGIGIAFRTIQGRKRLDNAQKVDWHQRFLNLENPQENYEKLKNIKSSDFGHAAHIENLKIISESPKKYPKPSKIYNAVIIATYNEAYDVLEPTIQSVLDSTFDSKKIIVVLAYEERGGENTKKTALKLQKKFSHKFGAFHLVEHPDGLPNEVIGKGGNITFAGKFLKKWLKEQKINSSNVILTTLDSDNRPHKTYFDYLAYEYIVHEDRKRLAYQPICLFTSNIWDVPAPMRVIATGNSFWNIISSMRPYSLRNFASHSQPMDALEDMNFWSTRTIVEDGHQYWRSYFFFKGNYSVTPIYVPIYQDAVLSDTLLKTLKAQFVQLRRWAYGASDVPYVACKVFTRDREVPFIDGISRFMRLLDSHVTLASIAILVAFGGWIPLLVNNEAARSVSAHQLPNVVSLIQQIALFGLFVTIFASFKMLPSRPERYKKHRSIGMVLQWILMPFTAIVYNASAALNTQGRLFLGKYLDRFDVTEKATVRSIEKAKLNKSNKHQKK